MKFTYAYKDSHGTRHTDSINAASRDEVFATLRARGIRAIKVVAADGSKANGEVRFPVKRVLALTLASALVALALSYFLTAHFLSPREGGEVAALTHSPRHQIYGDPAIVEAIEHGKTEAYLPRPGDRLLAYFAQPGRLMCPKGLTFVQLRRLSNAQVAEIEAALASPISLDADELREVMELKQIVNGIREELREYLQNGNGTIRSFWRRLFERTDQEAQIYERVKQELAKETVHAVWEQKNEALRNLGLRTIPTPQELE